MKKVLLYIILIVIGSGVGVYTMKLRGENSSKNGFVRKLSNPKISFKGELNLPFKQFTFAGKTDSTIVLNIYSDKLSLYKTDYSLAKLDTVAIKYPVSFNTNAKNIYKNNLSLNIYSSNPYGDISIFDGKSASFYKISGFRFDFFQAISPKTIVVRTSNNYMADGNRSLAKLTLSYSVKVDKKFSFPELNNGFFANDGILLYDRKSLKILYMYFYRGEFECLDTNLNLLYTSKTIDTVRSPLIKTGIINSKGKDGKPLKLFTQITPPKFVNTYITVDNKKVYILSKLRADNETQSEAGDSQMIDVYNIDNGKYIHSFRLPSYKGTKVSKFQVHRDLIIAIYGTDLVTYDLII